MLADRATMPAARTAATSVAGTASSSEKPIPKPVPTTAVTIPAVPTTLTYLAGIAAETTSSSDLNGLRDPSAVRHACAALLLLLVATTLSVYKPRGMTKYGQRKQHERRVLSQP